MLDANINISHISQLISRMAEYATCLECCKYYIAPMSATCGHTLCHDCWLGRRSCPTCSAPVNRRELRVNSVLNTLTEHLHTCCDEFEKAFNVNLNDLMLDIAVVRKDLKRRSNAEPVSHIDNWLTNSQNHFSAPITNSQFSTQDVVSAVKFTTNKIQIHTDLKKDTKIAKVVHVSLPQQDWDKIETMAEIEQSGNKDKDNIIGPTDIEPFFINENENTDETLRRSSRKRESKNNNCNVLSKIDTSLDKEHTKNLNTENEKRIQKTKSTWNSVKNMKKEFNKLNKTKKSKLDVSLEVTDKTENPVNKSNSEATLVVETIIHNAQNQDKYAMSNSNKKLKEENDILSSGNCTIHCLKSSSSVFKNEKKELITEIGKNKKVDKDRKNNDMGASYEHLQDDNNIVKNISETENTQTINVVSEIETSGNVKQKNNISSVIVATNQITDKCSIGRMTENNLETFDKQINAPEANEYSSLNKPEQKKPNIPFIKKSFLLDGCSQTSYSNKTVNDNAERDDIEISIRIGNSLAKINIRKKENNINFNINKDCAIQVALGPYGLTKSHCSIDQEIQVFSNDNSNKNGDICIDKNEVSDPVPSIKNMNTVSEKSISTKKHTASADTASAQFEITESVEKELSNIMECDEIRRNVNQSANCTQQSDKSPKSIKKTECALNLNDGTENAEYFNDVDLFDSETIKEPNVRLLTKTHRCPSEILAPSAKSVNIKTQKHSDKRGREIFEENDVPLSKRIKTNVLNTNKNNSKEVVDKSLQDSEPISYDQVMSQVFASIDADIGNNKKTQQLNLSVQEINISKQPKSNIQVIRKAAENEEITTQIEETNFLKERRSENIFSLVEKETLSKEKDKVPGIDTQKNIDNLLTPGVFCELTSSQEEQNPVNDADILENVIATPLDDDSDKSVVEDTPQKKSSFSRVSHKSDSKNITVVSNKKQELQDLNIDEPRRNTSVNSQNNLTLNSIVKSAKSKKALTPVNAKLLETPKSLINFSDHIQYKSTPVAKKSLNFCNNEQSENQDDPDQTICPTTTTTLVGQTTQEREFMRKAFEKTQKSPVRRPLMLKNSARKLCIGGSCLRLAETKKVQLLCQQRQWRFVEKYTEDLTHLVIGVDEENKAQRSVKYICALAAGKWIVNSEWVDQCLNSKEIVDEAAYEVLDSTGDAGPTYSRLAQRKLFYGITFCCLPPFSTLDVDTLKMILKAAGGHVVDNPEEARATSDAPALVIAEPDSTQDSRCTYLAIKLGVVPVNFEWALNCLGAYSLQSVQDLLLCPSALLPPATATWPAQLMARDDSVTFE